MSHAGDDDTTWEVIAEPSRRRILDLLLSGGESTSTALAAELPLTRQAITKHLVVLEEAGLVVGEKVGREMRYRVLPDRLDAAARAMAQVAARWDRRLEAIKRLAEDAARRGGDPARNE